MLSIDGTFIIVFSIVWVLFFVLTRLFYNPIRKVMAERKAKLDGDKNATELAIVQYEQKMKEIEESIKAARSSANATRDDFEKEALKTKDDMLKEISSECRSQVDEAKVKIEKEVDKIKKDLEKESEDLARKIEKKLLD